MTDDAAGGMPDISNLLAQAQQMQQQLLAARAEIEEQTVEGQSGGGAVKVRCSGGLDFESVEIRADAVDPADVAMLEDLVLAAVRDAVAKANALNQQALGGLGGLGGMLS